jgi:hypothetical protein
MQTLLDFLEGGEITLLQLREFAKSKITAAQSPLRKGPRRAKNRQKGKGDRAASDNISAGKSWLTESGMCRTH